jgi:transcriptional regulator with XRE-family HTH domain
MKTVAHWTQNSPTDFVYSISSNFIAQIETKIEADDISQNEIASKMGKTDGRVSQVLNSPGNLSIRVMVELARAIGMKVSIVAYDDDDPTNENGPIDPDVFVKCWEKVGRPANLFEAEEASACDIWPMYLNNVIGTDLSNKTAGQIYEYGASLHGFSGGFTSVYAPTKCVEPLGLLQRFQLGKPQVSNPIEPLMTSFQPELIGVLEKWHPQQSTTLVPKEKAA